jgi:neopullulanase
VTIDTPAWVRDAVFYQIFPDRFAASPRVHKPGDLEPWDSPPTAHGFKGGDLLGVVERLGYLAALGINAIYLNPVFASASNHRYHTYDYFAVDPLLGGNDALRELLDTAHGRGIRVILDGVFNHAGRGFWPFHHVLENGGASPYRDWFILDPAVRDGRRVLHAYPTAADPGAPDEPGPPGEHRPGRRSVRRLGYQAWWDLPGLPKLNIENPEVREHVLQVAEHWLRFGIDGWRLDVPEEIDDPEFWREFRRRCRAVNPEAYLVGEIWHPAPDWLAGDRFDAVMNYPLAEAIISYAGASTLDRSVLDRHHEYGPNVHPLDGPGFAARLTDLLSAYDPAVIAAQLNLLDSHDTPRLLTIVGGDRDACRLAVLLQATLPGAPSTYYGDEVGMEGGLDPDCRRAFPSDEAAWDHGLLAFVGSAFRLRRRVPQLRSDGVVVLAAEGDLIVLRRGGVEDAWLVAVNAGRSEGVIEARVAPGAAYRPEPLPGWSDAVDSPRVEERADSSGSLRLRVPARRGLVLRPA